MGSPLVKEIRRHGEEFLERLYRHVYLTSSGLEGEDSFAEIYRSHASLCEPDLAKSLREASFGEEEAAGKGLLLSFLLGSLMESRTASLRDEAVGLECGEEIGFGGRRLSLREARIALKLEPKRHRREEIAGKIAPQMERINETLRRTLDAWHSLGSELGYEGYLDMASDIIGETNAPELERLREGARSFLEDTRYAYRDLLGWTLNKRMPLSEPRWHDLEFLMNAFEFASYFGKGAFPHSLERFLDETGIEQTKSLHYDLEPRSGKLETVEALPLDPPREIAFALYPLGSIEDYSSFLRQAGKGLSFALAPEDDFFEFRYLRDRTALKAWGFLFENLILEPTWLRRYLRVESTRDLSVLLALRRLWRTRLATGRLLYSLELHRGGDFQSKTEAYKEIMGEATLSEHDPLHYLSEVEPSLGAAPRLRGILLESCLSPYLKERFDEQWWRMPEALEYLRRLWEAGGRTTGESIAGEIGLKELDFGAVIHWLEGALG